MKYELGSKILIYCRAVVRGEALAPQEFGASEKRTERELDHQLKFFYSEKAANFCKISKLLLSYVVPVKSKVEILLNFVAFSEYMNSTISTPRFEKLTTALDRDLSKDSL